MLKTIFRLQALAGILFFIAGVLATFALESLLEYWRDASNPPDLTVVSGALGIAGALVLAALYLNRRVRKVRARFRPPITVRRELDQWVHARKGLIAFVSLYRPPRDANLSREQIDTALKTNDFDLLRIEESNLRPVIRMAQIHASKLTHCWLISTTSTRDAGSINYAPLLATYLHKQILGDQCVIHSGEAYSISLDDDALVAVQAHAMVEKIYAEAQQHGLSDKDVVADFSAGQRSLMFGMITACLDTDRTVQFAGSAYDEDGNFKGDIFPILFEFTTEVNN